MKLLDIVGLNVQDALVILLTSPNALDYNELAEELYNDMPNTTPIQRLASTLCGTSNKIMASMFMNGSDMPQFIDNVAYNSNDSIPLIVKAIQLHYMNK